MEGQRPPGSAPRESVGRIEAETTRLYSEADRNQRGMRLRPKIDLSPYLASDNLSCSSCPRRLFIL